MADSDSRHDLDVRGQLREIELVPDARGVDLPETISRALVEDKRQSLGVQLHVFVLLVEQRAVDEVDRARDNGRRGIWVVEVWHVLQPLYEKVEDRVELFPSGLEAGHEFLERGGVNLEVVYAETQHGEQRDVHLCVEAVVSKGRRSVVDAGDDVLLESLRGDVV